MRLTSTHLLVLLSIIVTIIAKNIPEMWQYAMHGWFLQAGSYKDFLLQTVLYQFLHGDIFHLLANAFFLLIFAVRVEMILGQNLYFTFFLGNTVFVGAALLYFNPWVPTIGISGFAMATLAYFVLLLKKINAPEYKWLMLMLLLNVAIGLMSNISLTGHAAGAVFGLLFFWLTQNRTMKIQRL